MSGPAITVLIRAKDEAASIGRTLDLLAAQTIAGASEVIVVDSGSSDDTVAIARDHGARVIEIPAASFTYGGALNTGTAAARAPLVVALSAHAFPTDPSWLATMVDALSDDRVACAVAQRVDHRGGLLAGRIHQDMAMARENPRWGYSNHAGGYRVDLWRERPFREDMPFTEDREWSWYWMERGYLTAMDPGLIVEHSHGHDPLRDQYRRQYLMWQGFGMFLDVEPEPLPALLRRWWTDRETYRSAARARLSPRRLMRLAGDYAGRRSASRRS